MNRERLYIRLGTLSKQKLEPVAAYTRKSLSEYVLGWALHAADEVIQEHETKRWMKLIGGVPGCPRSSSQGER